MRRRIFLVLGLIFMSGCSSVPDRVSRREQIAGWFAGWFDLLDSTGYSSSQPHNDIEKARHEAEVIGEMNSLVENSPYRD